MSTPTANIDLSKFHAKLAGMTPEQLKAELLRIKTSQRVSQIRAYNPEKQRLSAAKRAEQVKAFEAAARELGFYDEIVQEASKLAKEQVKSTATNGNQAN